MISSLAALRKITKPGAEVATPIEGFQRYLEKKQESELVPTGYTNIKKGASIGLIYKTLRQNQRNLLTKSLYCWKFETIRQDLQADKSFLELQIKQILKSAILTFRHNHLSQRRLAFYSWKLFIKAKTQLPLIKVLNNLKNTYQRWAFYKLYSLQIEKTRLVYHIINSLLQIVRKKFLRWKLNSDNKTIGEIIDHKSAVINFQSFQREKVYELITYYRKIRQVIIKRAFFIWGCLEKTKVVVRADKVQEEKETVAMKKLKRQKEKHEGVVVEARIKEHLVEMMIQIFNVE
ncbi:hypothetical protein SteCoe_20599 [Stentor coeruleus]|uniref:Uncharacterized protein n=1 Tax=Stentor coeruleus TaxID=5963 RepID=A0A1R2BRM6_9CILI|nr:hypothetical protein SteCoe_20599 [Stentor coeruleus]